MKLSQNTKEILKNFSQSVNNTIRIEPGNILSAIQDETLIAGISTIEEEFPVSCTLFDTGQFLGALSTFKDPEIIFQERLLLIQEGKKKLKYRYADVVIHNKTRHIKAFKTPEAICTFNLNSDDFKSLIKNANSLSLPHLLIKGEEGKVTLFATDYHNDSTHLIEIDPEVETDRNFRFYFDIGLLKFLPGDHSVSLIFDGKKGAKGGFRAAVFKNEKRNLQYCVLLKSFSTME